MSNHQFRYHKKKRKLPLSAGFTLVELILYVAIVAIFMTGAIYFAWDVVYGREKAYQNQVVEQNCLVAMNKIINEIDSAQTISSITSTQIILAGQSDVTIELNSDRLQMTNDGAGPYYLTSNQARITNSDIFTDLSSVSNDSKNIKVKIICEQAQSAVPGQFEASVTMEESAELGGQFKDARKLLIDLTNANQLLLDIEGITLENTGSGDITIDKVVVSWTGSAGGENITAVQIGGGDVEWTGSELSDNTLELTDYVLTASTGPVNLDYISFDSNMVDSEMTISFVMADGSSAKAVFMVVSGGSSTPTPTPTPTSTPTPTPTPPPSCETVCIGLGYSSSSCYSNTRSCQTSGGTPENTGDQYCTGGPSADTCCCF